MRNREWTVSRDIRNLMRDIAIDVSRVEARVEVDQIRESALEATQTGYEVGTRNIVDVLQAQQRLFLSQFELADARYQYMLDLMEIKQTAGVIVEADLMDLNSFADSAHTVRKIKTVSSKRRGRQGCSMICRERDLVNAVVVAVSRSAMHTMAKSNHTAIRLIEALGVEGDAHCGATVKHRSRVARDPSAPNLRQVHLIHAELHDELRAAGFRWRPGQMGENITTRGIALLALPTGTLLHIGAAPSSKSPGCAIRAHNSTASPRD